MQNLHLLELSAKDLAAPGSTDNSACGTENLLLEIQVMKILHSKRNKLI